MPDVDLSDKIPKNARWLKIRYDMRPLTPGAQLLARVWSGNLDDAVALKGSSGDAFVRLDVPQKISYQRPANVELHIKVVAYKVVDESP